MLFCVLKAVIVTRADWPEETKLIIRLSFFSIGILANFLFCSVIARRKVLIKPMNFVFLNIAIVDIFVCLIWIVFSTSNWYRTWIFGEIGCYLSYGGLYVCYFFVALAIFLTFLANLFFKNPQRVFVFFGILAIWATSTLIYVSGEKIAIFVGVQWRNESVCVPKLYALLNLTKMLKIFEFLVPLIALITFIFVRSIEMCSGRTYLQSSKANRLFITMLFIHISYWIAQFFLEKYEILFLDVAQCLKIIYRPFLYLVMHEDVLNIAKNLVKRKKSEEELSPVEFNITRVDENI